jgi:hypothetical protein
MQALTRVGVDPTARFCWLLGFADRDLKDEATLEAARCEAYAFLLTGGGVGAQPTHVDLMVRALGAPPLSGPEGHRAVRCLQAHLRQTFASLRTERRFRGRVSITEAVWTEDGRLVPVAGGDDEQRFDFAVFGLLAELAPRLQTCAAMGCGRLFLKRGRMLYCGPSCSQRTRTARFKQARPEEDRQRRRARYVRRQQKALGSKVKVATVRRKS